MMCPACPRGTLKLKAGVGPNTGTVVHVCDYCGWILYQTNDPGGDKR